MEIEDHPAALRNRQPILDVLSRLLASDARVLEVASGNGTHASYCTAAMPGLHWQPTETDPEKLAVLQQRFDMQVDKQVNNQGIQPPMALNVLTFDWPSQQVDALLAINLVHIAPIAVTDRLLSGATQALADTGLLLLYGPYRVNGEHTSTSNAEFDQNLRRQNASWGIRNIQAVEEAAAAYGLALQQTLEMPANNKFLVFARMN